MMTIILNIVVLAVICWALTTFIPMPEAFDYIITVVCVIVAVLWACQMFGLNVPQVPLIFPNITK